MPVVMIVPGPINIQEIRMAVDTGLVETQKVTVEADMETVTETWGQNTKPAWETVGPRTLKDGRAIDYKTSDTPFLWVNDGTKGPYPIPKSGPHPKGLGPFQVEYIPKTQPKTLQSGPGGRFGPFISPKRVMHPGIEAREFTTISALRAEERLGGIIQQKLNEVRSL